VIEKSQHELPNLQFPNIGTTFTKDYTLLTCTLDKFGWKIQHEYLEQLLIVFINM